MKKYDSRTVEKVLSTRGRCHAVDVTGMLAEAVESEGLYSGTALVFVPGATAAVTTIEYEPGVLGDLEDVLEEIAPSDRRWKHDAAWGDGNGYSHLRAALVGPSLAVPVSKGSLLLGTWQQVVVFDFDNRPRRRRVVFQLSGVFER